MKKVYAYYQSIPLSNQNEEFSCANWWKHSWEKNGWTNTTRTQNGRNKHLASKEAVGFWPQQLASHD